MQGIEGREIIFCSAISNLIDRKHEQSAYIHGSNLSIDARHSSVSRNDPANSLLWAVRVLRQVKSEGTITQHHRRVLLDRISVGT